jgi:NADPH-dependent 2,4-dienoyl-CoA reductase/sulfur reductase-like enzyme
LSSNTITEPARQTPVYGEFDVVVVGGGPAGIMAATAAARAGCATLLIERYGFLGGAGTAGDRIAGAYQLTEEDVLGCADFEAIL